MNELVCVCISVYRDALTPGRSYTVLATDAERSQVRIKGDNGRTRWFPTYCFDRSDRSVPTLKGYQLGDQITSERGFPVEVTVQLSNGERRWCIFATPSGLANCGDWIEGTEIPFHYGNRHVIVVGELSEELVGRVLQYMDSQGVLIDCTLALEPADDETASN